MKKNIFVLIFALVFLVFGVLYVNHKDPRVFENGVPLQFMRGLRAILAGGFGSDLRPYVDEFGNYPKSLNILAQELVAENRLMNFRGWNGLYYVSGLSTNDPPNMPLIIKSHKKYRTRGADDIFTVGGDIENVSDYTESEWNLLLTQPWELVRDEFKDVHEYESFTNRLALIKTEGIRYWYIFGYVLNPDAMDKP